MKPPGQLALTGLILGSILLKNAATHAEDDVLSSNPFVSKAEIPVFKPNLIAHKRRHHPRRNHDASVNPVSRTPASSRAQFSLNFFHDLQVHLGLTLGTNRSTTTAQLASSPGPEPVKKVRQSHPGARPVSSKKIKHRNPRVQPEMTGIAPDELLPMGYPWYTNSHVPFRYRYKYSSSYIPATKLQAEDASVAALRSVDFCVLSRWNFELPFSELPNMAAKALASDMVSGETTAAKARYMFELLQQSLDSYVKLDVTGDVFDIPAGTDLAKCNFKKSEDPLFHSVNQLLKLYSDQAKSSELLFALVKAAKACLGKEDQPFPLELLPCLDFSFGSDQVLKLAVHRSIFANEELCRRYLHPVVEECVPVEKHPCTALHIEALNSFARNFYQCPEMSERPLSTKKPGAQQAMATGIYASQGGPTASDIDEDDMAYLMGGDVPSSSTSKILVDICTQKADVQKHHQCSSISPPVKEPCQGSCEDLPVFRQRVSWQNRIK